VEIQCYHTRGERCYTQWSVGTKKDTIHYLGSMVKKDEYIGEDASHNVKVTVMFLSFV
jgi:hypothetical protein